MDNLRRETSIDSALRLLESYDAAALVQDLIARKPIRVSVPESLTGYLRLPNVDWAREVEIPPRDGFAGNAPDFDQLVQGMAEPKGRLLGLQMLVYLWRGRIFYTMLGGTRYAARVDWSSTADAASPASSPGAESPGAVRPSQVQALRPGLTADGLPQGRLCKGS